MDERDMNAARARMGPEEREVAKALVREGSPREALTFAEIFAYFPEPGVRLATEEEVARLEVEYDEVPGVDRVHPASATQDISEGSAQRSSAPPSENFPIPQGRRGDGGVARRESTSRAGTNHLRFIAGQIYCPFVKQRFNLGDEHVYGSAFDCPGCGGHVAERPETIGARPVASENVETKGRRMLTEGRLLVERVDAAAREIRATCRGDSGEIYQLGFRGDQNRWGCTCEARGNCAHLVALKLVTVKP